MTDDAARPLTKHIQPGREPLSLAEYERAGGYQGLQKALAMSPKEVQAEVTAAGLRGRGGAGFPTGVKWGVVPMDETAHPKYLVVNADEMEPGTMKDRLLLEGDPHLLLEGMLIAAHAIGADAAFIFLRWAYKTAARRLARALAEVQARHLTRVQLHLHTGAGRYMCGEETALLNALEGKRANPRAKPPFPQTRGLWGQPTIVNNVETLCNLPGLLAHGTDWYRGLSTSADGGTKLYGVSGRVKRPGVWELPLGATAREILDDCAGGMADGYALRGWLPGGASTNIHLPHDLDLPLDFAAMEKAGSRLGTGTIIVVDDHTCPVGLCLNLIRFFARESCGWCTPCREGLPWVARTLAALEAGAGTSEDLAVLDEHVRFLAPGHTFCALAPGAMAPLGSALRHFREDFQRHIAEQRCPWG